MSPSTSRRKDGGFTLIEVMIATAILVIAVSAMAALAAVMLTQGRQSRYLSVAETLASEKLEDLSRYQIAAPQICVQSGDATEGALTDSPSAVVSTSITCPNSSTAAENISYYDFISIDFISSGNCPTASTGCFAETIYNGSQYVTTYHSPDGTIPGGLLGMPIQSTTPPANMTTYLRTWMIEANPIVGNSGQNTATGNRRITVRVTNITVQPPVSFQLSLVRQ